jgi:methylthioribose-1-phosphate isomerase
MKLYTIRYKNRRLDIIDQRLLPAQYKRIQANSLKDVYTYIKTLAIRGAPAIGVFAAYGLSICALNIKSKDKGYFFRKIQDMSDYIKSSRPTAVNLSWALESVCKAAYDNRAKDIDTIKAVMLKQARMIHLQDQRMCEGIGINGSRLIRSGDTILTHCNAGSLAATGTGTALAVLYKAKEQGKDIHVYADETRPLLQGARLTAWELQKNGIDTTVICDSMAGFVMQQGRIDKVIVGADRIARNGDTANKIGTYSLAVLAKEHNIPFYIAAPSSTMDAVAKNGSQITIEQRSPDEVRKLSGIYCTPRKTRVYNPAFDITPARYIKAIITEKGIMRAPYERSLMQ